MSRWTFQDDSSLPPPPTFKGGSKNYLSGSTKGTEIYFDLISGKFLDIWISLHFAFLCFRTLHLWLPNLSQIRISKFLVSIHLFFHVFVSNVLDSLFVQLPFFFGRTFHFLLNFKLFSPNVFSDLVDAFLWIFKQIFPRLQAHPNSKRTLQRLQILQKASSK